MAMYWKITDDGMELVHGLYLDGDGNPIPDDEYADWSIDNPWYPVQYADY